MTNSLEHRFKLAVDMACKQSIEHGYNPTIYQEMLKNYGAVKTAEKLVVTAEAQKGFVKLMEMGYSELTIEHIMNQDEFSGLFDEEKHLAPARFRLEKFNELKKLKG